MKDAPKVLGHTSISKWAIGARAERRPSWSGGAPNKMAGTKIYIAQNTEATQEFNASKTPLPYLFISLPILCHQGLPTRRYPTSAVFHVDCCLLVAAPALVLPQSSSSCLSPPPSVIIDRHRRLFPSFPSVCPQCLLIVVLSGGGDTGWPAGALCSLSFVDVVVSIVVSLSSRLLLPLPAIGCCCSSPSTLSLHPFVPVNC